MTIARSPPRKPPKMSELDRRTFLALAGAAALAPSAAAQPASAHRDIIIVNALGGLIDLNTSDDQVTEESRRTVSDRVIADARASGLTAVNVTLGYVAGDDEPFEETVRTLGRWEAR